MLQIHRLPAFTDNYFWLFHAEGSSEAYVVDPGDAAPVERALEELHLELTGILLTHHHFDHTGGVEQLAGRHHPEIFGPDSDKISGVERVLREGDHIEVAGERFDVFEVPGHTLDHIAYHCAGAGVLFCGDTLFAGGCGRLFEGTPAQMHASLSKLAALPEQTAVYCAHEYTTANLRFALQVEPDNKTLQARMDEVRQLRAAEQATVPSSIGLERATNPFLRVAESSVRQAAERHTGAPLGSAEDVLGAVRAWKDNA